MGDPSEKVVWDYDEVTQTFAQLRQAGLDRRMMRWIRQDDGANAKKVADFVEGEAYGHPQPSFAAPSGAIVIPAVHPDKETLVRAYQSQFGTFWADPEHLMRVMHKMASGSKRSVGRELEEALENGCPDPPSEPSSPFQVRVLCFGARELVGTVDLALETMEKFRAPFQDLKSNSIIARTCLVPGKFHKRGLYWAVLDVASALPSGELQKTPHRLAGVEVLYALATQKLWCRAMFEGEMPRVLIGGLRYSTDAGGKKMFAIDNSGSLGKLRLQLYPEDAHSESTERAVPILM